MHMYYSRLLVYDIINVSLWFSYGVSTKCIGYNYTICIGANGFACIIAPIHLSSYSNQYIWVRIVTDTLEFV